MAPNKPIYVVQKHDAIKAGLHYDLRLQVMDTLFSWAIPKGIPEEYRVRRLAIRTQNHAMSWSTFEGSIPKGEYGAGTVSIWDKGWYEPLDLYKGYMKFIIHGKKLKGIWQLSLMKGNPDRWLIERVED